MHCFSPTRRSQEAIFLQPVFDCVHLDQPWSLEYLFHFKVNFISIWHLEHKYLNKLSQTQFIPPGCIGLGLICSLKKKVLNLRCKSFYLWSSQDVNSGNKFPYFETSWHLQTLIFRLALSLSGRHLGSSGAGWNSAEVFRRIFKLWVALGKCVHHSSI